MASNLPSVNFPILVITSAETTRSASSVRPSPAHSVSRTNPVLKDLSSFDYCYQSGFQFEKLSSLGWDLTRSYFACFSLTSLIVPFSSFLVDLALQRFYALFMVP